MNFLKYNKYNNLIIFIALLMLLAGCSVKENQVNSSENINNIVVNNKSDLGNERLEEINELNLEIIQLNDEINKLRSDRQEESSNGDILGVDRLNWNQFLNMWIEAEDDRLGNKTARKEILSAILSYHVEEIVRGAESEQEKCVRIAQWISSNISNREPVGNDEYGWYAYRSGLCGARARLFVEMLKYQHIPARVFNMYNFGRVGGGHSCAQAYYDGKWHFFDVTYAGMFVRNDNVLSWDEIVSNPKQAMEDLVVFENTLDRWGAVDEDPVSRRKVNNDERMHVAYSEDILKGAKSYGFYRYDDVKTLYPLIDWNIISEDKLSIGNLDNDFNDVNTVGVQKKISEQLGVALGTGTDTFHTTWEFKNCDPGRVYCIKYYIYKSNVPDITYWARGEDANLISGGTFISNESLVNGDLQIWEIKFTPIKAECSISVGYDFRDQQKLLFTDMIEIIK